VAIKRKIRTKDQLLQKHPLVLLSHPPHLQRETKRRKSRRRQLLHQRHKRRQQHKRPSLKKKDQVVSVVEIHSKEWI